MFEDREVEPKEVKELLKTAIWVPNHKMTQPWRFVIITGETKEQLAQLAGDYMGKGKQGEERDSAVQKAYQTFKQVPVFLMVLMEENHILKLNQEDYAATSLIIHNLSLLAWEKGLGMVWKTGPLTDDPAFRELIGINKGEKFVGMVQIGYPKKVPKARPRIDVEERITELN